MDRGGRPNTVTVLAVGPSRAEQSLAQLLASTDVHGLAGMLVWLLLVILLILAIAARVKYPAGRGDSRTPPTPA